MPAAEVPARRSWQLAAGEGSHTSQVLSASQPCSLAEGGEGRGGRGQGKLVAEAAVDPRQSLPASETRCGKHLHRDVHRRCGKDSSCPHTSLGQSLPNC